MARPELASRRMDILAFTDVGADDEAVLFQLYAAVRADELGMHTWDPAFRDQILQFQFQAQRRGYAGQFPNLEERLILLDARPVGWVIVDRNSSSLHCVDIAIASEARSKGVGTRVMRALQEEATAANRPLMLMVLRTNVRAFTFYDRLGFRVSGGTDTHALLEWRSDWSRPAIGDRANDDDAARGRRR